MAKQKFTNDDNSYREGEASGVDKVNPLSYNPNEAAPRFFGSGGGRAPKFFGVLLLVVLGGFLASMAFSSGFGGFPRVPGDKWQAVFLNNNQVYFGKLKNNSKRYVELRNIFYLRASQPLQQGATSAPELSLVKLGGELHGPEDIMYVPKDNILFWENMKDDSQVVQAITNFLNQSEGQ